MPSIRILMVNDSAKLAEALREGQSEACCPVVATLPADLHQPERVAELSRDLIVIDEEGAGRDIVEHVCVATRHEPRPIVLFTQDRGTDRMQRAIAAGVSSCLVAGLEADRRRGRALARGAGPARAARRRRHTPRGPHAARARQCLPAAASARPSCRSRPSSS